MIKVIILFVFLALQCWGENLTVFLHYGDAKPDRVIETTYSPGMSALDVLNRISRVEASKTGNYRFVRSIDGVQSQIGKFGWFYLIDGESVNTTAENFILNDAKTMTWVYKVEACY